MIDFADLRDQINSGMAASGLFEKVLGHEPKAAMPSTGVSGAVWNSTVRIGSSGLAALSAVITFQVRIYTSMLAEPQDDIDPRVLAAADALIAYLAGRFTLTGEARYIDFRGSDSEGLRADTGYLEQDKKIFRVVDVFIPVIVNDAYPLTA